MKTASIVILYYALVKGIQINAKIVIIFFVKEKTFLLCFHRKFVAHKAILAFTSDFLKEMIEENINLQPGNTTIISIPDVDPEIIEQILTFVYTGM